MQVTQPVIYDKKNPFPAKLVEKKRLTHPESDREIVHFVIDISGSGINYTCGDSLGIYPTNNPDHVQDILNCLNYTGLEKIQTSRSNQTLSIKEALKSQFSLSNPTKNFLSKLREKCTNLTEKSKLEHLLHPDTVTFVNEYLENCEFIDLLHEFPSATFTPQEFVDNLKILQPRLYSIASAPSLYPNEVHLTVRVYRYEMNFRRRMGVASTFLTDRVNPFSQPVPVFLASSHFGLPEDPSRDMIMVGPGTGVAPYRAFIQEHIHRGGHGKTWLFFGNQCRSLDYLYGHEWDHYHQKKQLTRLDLAFSRDQKHKIYVQHKMAENAKELWRWLESGAYFFLCGDMKNMAKDVEASLLQIIQQEGSMSEAAAQAYLKQMKRDKRYQKDVY